MRFPPRDVNLFPAAFRGRPQARRPGCLLALLVVGGIALLLLTLVGSLVDLFTDALWFDSIGYRSVFNAVIGARAALFLGGFLLATGFILGNWLLARWVARREPRFFGQEDPLGHPGLGYALWGGAIVAGLLLGIAAQDAWQVALLYLNRKAFAASDPIFGLNVGYYVFDLPAARQMQGWLIAVVLVALLGVISLYLVARRPQLQARIFRIPRGTRIHVGLLAAAIALLWAWAYWLDRFDILFSPTGVVYGAGYTDIHALLPAFNILALLLVAMAGLCLLFAFTGWWLPLTVGVGAWLLVSIGMRGIYPAVMQNYQVRPNEYTLEEPYIRNGIDGTLRAYGLDKIVGREFDPVPLTTQTLNDNAATIRNLRLWDYRPLRDTYAQLQEIRSYYDFVDVDIDRYNFQNTPDGTQSVTLSARELSSRQIQNPTWVNTHLEFTHGYGLVMSPVNEVTQQGTPVFFIGNLPPITTVPIAITQPAIYFGEATDSYVFVKTKRPEFDYPVGDTNAQVYYQGSGGVPIGSFWHQLAFAYRFGDSQILFTDAFTPESRVMFHRLIKERNALVAPFLDFDGDPYLVVADGRLWWIQDAYTTSANYPYSRPYTLTRSDRSRIGPVNYIRNSVKIVSDAYNGDIQYYVADPTDPIVQAWQSALPTLFRPLDEMPAALRPHIRYPEDLFRIQVDAYNTFHMTDPKVFYNREDPWAVAQEIVGDQRIAVEPYYVLMRLEGEARPEFLLIQPFTPARKDNMIAWLAARSDAPHYGQLVVYNFPKQQNVQGPLQVEARIDQEPSISAQLSLWNQRGSRVIRGNLLVIPVGSSLLYVEPIYLQADQAQIPQLQRVVLASQNQPPVMRPTLQEALQAWNAGHIVSGPVEQTPGGAIVPTLPTTPGAPTRDVAAIVKSAQGHYDASQEALRSGEWARYGQEQDALRRDLEELAQLTGR